MAKLWMKRLFRFGRVSATAFFGRGRLPEGTIYSGVSGLTWKLGYHYLIVGTNGIQHSYPVFGDAAALQVRMDTRIVTFYGGISFHVRGWCEDMAFMKRELARQGRLPHGESVQG